MTGWCVPCRKAYRVPSTRGSRLAGRKCSDCGSELVGTQKYRRLIGDEAAHRDWDAPRATGGTA